MSQPELKASVIRGVRFGQRVTVVEPANLYDCELGDDCFIGPFVEIQRGVRLGSRSKVQSHSFVCEMVSIGEDCVIAHGVMFINDLFRRGSPAHGDRTLWRATCIGDHVLIGSNATILPVRICDRVVIGAGAVVTRDILLPGIYAGNPARRLRTLTPGSALEAI
jgi:acetyltransferase-like isoleucine patch superfamily enzyme